MTTDRPDREPTLAELCKPLSAKIQPKGALVLRLGAEPTPKQRDAYLRAMGRAGRRTGAHI